MRLPREVTRAVVLDMLGIRLDETRSVRDQRAVVANGRLNDRLLER